MRRRYGYSPRGQKLVVRGETGRSQRISLLCFANVHGLVEAPFTEGTFTRAIFFQHCRQFALSGKVEISLVPTPFGLWMVLAFIATHPLSTICASLVFRYAYFLVSRIIYANLVIL